MNRTRILILSLCVIAGVAEAMFVKLSQSELLEQSDLIVVGELVGRESIDVAGSEAPLMLGVIRVAETLRGAPGKSVVFIALPGQKFALSTDLMHRDGQRGLWYLRLRNPDDQGLYAADHPQRFVPIEQAAAQIEALRQP